MSNLVRWEPFREMVSLREAMDRLFNESFLRPLSWEGGLYQGIAVDMWETANDVVVQAAVAGLKPEEIKINLTGDVLNVSGETAVETENKEATYHVRERRYGAFSRSITLPTPVIAEKVKAEFENGVLTITLPKSEAVRPKAITIKAK